MASLPPIPNGPEYKERLQWHLARVDSWITNADTKATIILGIDGAILAALIGLHILVSGGRGGLLLLLARFISGVSLFTSMILAASAVLPDIGGGATNPRERSILHFIPVSSEDIHSFRGEYRALSEDEVVWNLENQIHVNSGIAANKFKKLRASVWALLVFLLSGSLLLLSLL